MEKQSQKPIVICGPSGVGKGTLLRALMAELPDTFGVSVSDTTRSPRDKELDGVHYNFINRDTFIAGIDNERYIENLQFGDNLYGTSYQAVEDVHKKQLICVLEIHIDSAQFIKNNTSLQCNYLFISVKNAGEDSLKTLERRLRTRNSENERQIERRLEAAKKELKFAADNPSFFDAIIYNDDTVDSTLNDLVEQLSIWYPQVQSRKKW
eukprot:CAMPEP_0202692894 /NCGR_PEP_ID=MMETSP1385-20130828/7158_1 /ASSEMBLY_ACC=CAM_ASM_000861 /TAXON_ID=933848 /ORGANISM="Elphidium margaritaceum" /LENGTH=208 /DNA_ID=CAMNT_0049348497 /DNA_START=93 /DNA_END=716 /DNA_ORIENTATION=+